jgi:1,4-dihydroxy-2-naphthoate octaprenyltransferase
MGLEFKVLLPVYIGKQKALWVYKSLYIIAYIDIAILSIIKVVPLLCLVSIFTWIPVYKNIQSFYKQQGKNTTFVLAVKNLLLMGVPFILLLGLSWVLNYFK